MNTKNYSHSFECWLKSTKNAIVSILFASPCFYTHLKLSLWEINWQNFIFFGNSKHILKEVSWFFLQIKRTIKYLLNIECLKCLKLFKINYHVLDFFGLKLFSQHVVISTTKNELKTVCPIVNSPHSCEFKKRAKGEVTEPELS